MWKFTLWGVDCSYLFIDTVLGGTSDENRLRMVPPFFIASSVMIHIGKLIEAELHRQERTVTWFANKLYCDRTNVYKIFRKQSIDTELLLRISHILNYNFFHYYGSEFSRETPNSL